ncbi:MAG: 6-phosphofructokinase [Candidatus Margulisbacteria bacterium]|nr:6-phosphofructokinase [Candidatus Margulisiibacteriota bacterium]
MTPSTSPLDALLINDTVPVNNCFLNNGKISPISFRRSTDTLPIEPETKSQLPHISNAQSGFLLEAEPSYISPQNKRIAVLFSGGPASGGHNVVLGIHQILGPKNTLLGVTNGPKGLLEGRLSPLTTQIVSNVKNRGGFDLLGTDRTKIKTEEQFKCVRAIVKKEKIDAIIIIGGDDSNTNAALLAEYLYSDNCAVIGVPKTIDGDLQIGSFLPISFGFDTATRIYAEMVGNICQDTKSSLKYWHFIKLMGRSASQVTLEVALRTQPAITLISEEIAKKKWSLETIIEKIANRIAHRASQNIFHGVVLLPEGLIEFVPHFKDLISESSKDQDSHGNLKVSQIETEQLLVELVTKKLSEILPKSTPFNAQTHFFGYEGRCGAPTRFDQAFTLNLGLTAGSLALGGHTGYMASIGRLDSGGQVLAIPLSSLIHTEKRHGKETLVIEKALVELDSPAFKYFDAKRDKWAETDCFLSPGPRQMWGPLSNNLPKTVCLNQGYSKDKFDLG